MPDVYGLLGFVGLCVVLAVWLHAHQQYVQRRRWSGEGKRIVTARRMPILRRGQVPTHEELERLAGAVPLPVRRAGDSPGPVDSLESAQGMEQTSIWLPMHDQRLQRVLYVEFFEPQPGIILCALLRRFGMQPKSNGMYCKMYESQGLRKALCFAANYEQDKDLERDGVEVDWVRCVTLFQTLPLPIDGRKAFAGMLRIAEGLRKELGGRFLGEDGTTLTASGLREMEREVEKFTVAHPGLGEVH